MASALPQCVDTVIIGNGPSALILSYLLHGHIPYYIGSHHDAILDSKLSIRPNLLNLTSDLHAHFLSSLRYSTQALPINTLLDTLIRPNADTEINPRSCIEWRHEPDKAVSHLVLGKTAQPGGQWAENPVSASADIGTLSYAEQLSLPGYSYADHLTKSGRAGQCDFVRPSRAEVADYLKAYPAAVGITDAVYTSTKVDNVYRIVDGFIIGSLGVRCKHLVLASGIFTVNIPPPPLLAPIAQLQLYEEPLLVIGSGFTAADIIISTPPTRKIIHMFQWTPDTRPSPLRGCHHTAYPEYAAVYRQMKISSISSSGKLSARSPLLRRKSNSFFSQRNWSSFYEGLPNAEVLSVTRPNGTGPAMVKIRIASGVEITRLVGGLEFVVGRRGSVDYLAPKLRSEVLDASPQSEAGPWAATTSAQKESLRDSILNDNSYENDQSPTLISGRTLRAKAEASLEVSKNVFIIGSLAGDSLIRHAIGGCVYTTGRILGHIASAYSPQSSPYSTAQSSPAVASDSHSNPDSSVTSLTGTTDGNVATVANGHSDLHLDRRTLAKAVEVANTENRYWEDSGWWAGGLGYPKSSDMSK